MLKGWGFWIGTTWMVGIWSSQYAHLGFKIIPLFHKTDMFSETFTYQRPPPSQFTSIITGPTTAIPDSACIKASYLSTATDTDLNCIATLYPTFLSTQASKIKRHLWFERFL